MKAILLEQAGPVENFIQKDIPKPTISSNEVLVEVKAIGVNPVDYKVRGIEEVMTMIYGPERPAILGWDIAGTVSEVGDDVSDFQVGDQSSLLHLPIISPYCPIAFHLIQARPQLWLH